MNILIYENTNFLIFLSNYWNIVLLYGFDSSKTSQLLVKKSIINILTLL